VIEIAMPGGWCPRYISKYTFLTFQSDRLRNIFGIYFGIFEVVYHP